MQRSDYIGSSDAKDILSGDWNKLWRRKMGLEPDADLSDSFPVQLGVHTEEFHVDWTIRRLRAEKDADWQASTKTPTGDQHFATATLDTAGKPLLGSHPDALLRLASAPSVVYPLEAKITGRFSTAEAAADFYMPQLQHHMLCWDVDLALLSVVIGTDEPVRLWVGASPEWQAYYAERCDAFWQLLSTRQAPSPFVSDGESTVYVPPPVKDSVPINGLKRLCIDGSNQAPGLIAEFIETKRAVKRHDEIKDALKAMMPSDVGEIYTSDGTFKAKKDARGAVRFTLKDAA
jgi:hypothetical protein